MSSSFLQYSLFMKKIDHLSFHQWQKNHLHYQQKQDRLLWGGSLVGSSIFLMGITWIAFHLSYQKLPPPVIDTPPAILLDLSKDLAPASPPPMAVQPEAQPLEDQSIPLDAPMASDPEITLPKTQNIEKIKPIQHQKTTTKQIKIIHEQKPIPPVLQTVNSIPSSSNVASTSSSSHAASNSSSNASSEAKSSISPKTWQGLVLQKLERLKRYPTDAQNDKQEGIATIKITINRDGHVLAVQLIKSSGYSLLDKEAMTLPHRADPLPIVPNTITGNKITLTVPVEFYLN